MNSWLNELNEQLQNQLQVIFHFKNEAIKLRFSVCIEKAIKNVKPGKWFDEKFNAYIKKTVFQTDIL